MEVVLKLSDDVSTDLIYAGKFMATILPAETGRFLFADYDEFNLRLNSGQIRAGDIIVAGKNFGCGSSREQAVSALKYWELTVIAESFSPIFFRNAINLGLNIVQAESTLLFNEGDLLQIGPEYIAVKDRDIKVRRITFPNELQRIIDAGGLISFIQKNYL